MTSREQLADLRVGVAGDEPSYRLEDGFGAELAHDEVAVG